MKTSHMDVLSANGDSFGVNKSGAIETCNFRDVHASRKGWCCLFPKKTWHQLYSRPRKISKKRVVFYRKCQFWGCDFWMSGQSTYYNQSHKLTWVLFLFEKSFSSQWFAICWFDSRKIQQKQPPLAKRISDQKVGRYPKVWDRKMAPKSGDQDPSSFKKQLHHLHFPFLSHRDPCM